MLIAIGIYAFTQDIPPKFVKIDSAQPNKGLTIFSSNLLEPLESHTLPILTSEDLQLSKPQHFPQNGEHHYIKGVVGEPNILYLTAMLGLSVSDTQELQKLAQQSPQQSILNLASQLKLSASQSEQLHKLSKQASHQLVLVMNSRSELEDTEAHYLFINMLHAYIRPVIANVTLQKIIDNPMGYTGKDCNLARIKQDLEETKKIMIENIDKIIERGEKLERLNDTTIRLQQASQAFEEEAKKLNSC